MEFIVIAVLIGLIPASIARSKGRSFGLWWFYGSALFIVALPHSLMMPALQDSVADLKQQALQNMAGAPTASPFSAPASADTKICPDCAETVKAAARKCRHCGYTFVAADGESAGQATEPHPGQKGAPILTPAEREADRLHRLKQQHRGII